MHQSNADRRLTFAVAKELCSKNGLDVTKANPAYGFVRFETPLLDGQTQYSFPVLENQTYNGYNQSPTEKRMKLQDNFVVGSKGFFLMWYNKTTNRPASTLLTYVGPYNDPKQYAYGNDVSNGYSARTLLLKGGINELWNSAWMKYSFDYNVIIPRWDMLQHYYSPQTQAQFNTILGGDPPDPTASFQYPWTMDQRDGMSDGFVPMEPNIVISGAKNTEINYYLPFSLSFADDFGWDTLTNLEPRLVVIYRGVLLQNTTSVKG